MIRDVQSRVQTLGSVGAILLGGDIAYKGHPDEYKAAFEWVKNSPKSVSVHWLAFSLYPETTTLTEM